MRLNLDGTITEVIHETERSYIFLLEHKEGQVFACVIEKDNKIFYENSIILGETYELRCELNGIRVKSSNGNVFINNNIYVRQIVKKEARPLNTNTQKSDN